MFNSVKAKLFLNAFRNLKVSAKSGGNGSFKMKGLQFDLPRKEIVLWRDKDGNPKRKEMRDEAKVSISNIELIWHFPVGFGQLENGIIDYKSEESAKLSFKIEGLKVNVEDDVDFFLDFLELEGVQEVKEFFLSLPLEQMAEIGVLLDSEKAIVGMCS